MENKTKNIIIIVLSVLLFISVMFNVINFKPMMHNKMNNNMMHRDFNRSMDMPNDRNNQGPNNNQLPSNNQDNSDNQNESNQKVE